MRYISILITMVLIAGMIIWYMKSGGLTPTDGAAAHTTPQQTVKQAEDTARALQQTLEQQQKQIEQQK